MEHPRESKFTKGRNPICPDDHLWSARDEQSSEDEVNEFLYALVRLIKPTFAIETGSYLGDGTLAIARAMRDNGRGKVYACDIIQERVDAVNDRLGKENLQYFGLVGTMPGTELVRQMGGMTDFAFIDSSPDGRERGAEIAELRKRIRPGTIFALHDTAPQHGSINAMAQGIDAPQIYFNCPRGFTLYQEKKKHK